MSGDDNTQGSGSGAGSGSGNGSSSGSGTGSGNGGAGSGPGRAVRRAGRIVLAHPVGRLAVVVVAFATVGLTTRYWAIPVLALAVPRLRAVEVTA